MAGRISNYEATQLWAPFVDVLAEHHIDLRAEDIRCACGHRPRSRPDFARHQVAQLVLTGALPPGYELQWALVRAGATEPEPMSYPDAMRENNRHQPNQARLVCRSIFPPGPWIEDIRSTP